MARLDQQGTAAFLDVSERTLEDWRYRGGGPPYYKVGKKITYELPDLEAFRASRRRTSTSDRGKAA